VYFLFFKGSKWIIVLNLFTAIFLCPSPSFAQDIRRVDSLKSLLQKTVDDKLKCDVLYALSTEYGAWDPYAALDYAEKGLQLAIDLGDTLRVVKGHRVKGQLYRRVDDLTHSIKSFREGETIASRHRFQREIREEYKDILNGIAITYTFFADYDKALEYNFKSLLLHEEDNNKGDISIVLNNIGLVYFKLKNYLSALEYYEKSLQYKLESDDHFDLDRLLINMGLCYNQIKDFPQAQNRINEAFQVCAADCSNEIMIEGQFALGVSFYGMKDYSNALKHFQESLKISTEIGNKRFQTENLIYIAHVHVNQRDTGKAIDVLNQVEELASAAGFNEILIQTYKEFANVYTLRDEFKLASFYKDKYITLKDSIYSGEQDNSG
jgi:tetratricopeptide (TPR) repeat protein